MSDLFYLNDQGQQVWTSQYLKNKKTCCKTGCLHCPYGFTLKKFGLTFQMIEEKDLLVAQDIQKQSGKSLIDLKTVHSEDRYFLLIKNHIAGVFAKNKIQIKHLWLKPEFSSQDLSVEMIESYFF